MIILYIFAFLIFAIWFLSYILEFELIASYFNVLRVGFFCLAIEVGLGSVSALNNIAFALLTVFYLCLFVAVLTIKCRVSDDFNKVERIAVAEGVILTRKACLKLIVFFVVLFLLFYLFNVYINIPLIFSYIFVEVGVSVINPFLLKRLKKQYF